MSNNNSGVNRIAKGFVGAVLGAFFLTAMSVMSSVYVFNLTTEESVYGWINTLSLIIGSAAGAVLLSRVKWWGILVVGVVIIVMFSIVMSKVA